MGRRRHQRRKKEETSSEEAVAGIIGFIFVCTALYFWKFIAKHPYWFAIIIGVTAGIVICSAVYLKVYADKRKQSRIDALAKEITQGAVGQEVINFISRFGTAKGRKDDMTLLRSYAFENHRISDFRTHLEEKGIDFGNVTLTEILESIIDAREANVTVASIEVGQNELSNLSGAEFEQLLVRLYTAMGFVVQHIGHTGDQGGDLIANKGGERSMIQAKRYASTVGNKAVQEAAAARAHYDCHKAIVVTTSDFTREAHDLAATNKVLLVNGQHLRRMLLEYLKESWR